MTPLPDAPILVLATTGYEFVDFMNSIASFIE
jgi:hypothetical protein